MVVNLVILMPIFYRNGEDNISILNFTDNQYVYFNPYETEGGTTTLALDFYNYMDTFSGSGTVFNEFGFFANYGNRVRLYKS